METESDVSTTRSELEIEQSTDQNPAGPTVLSPNSANRLLNEMMDTIGIQKDQLINFIEEREILTINAFNGSTLSQKDEFVESFWYYKNYN